MLKLCGHVVTNKIQSQNWPSFYCGTLRINHCATIFFNFYTKGMKQNNIIVGILVHV